MGQMRGKLAFVPAAAAAVAAAAVAQPTRAR